jgi:hypothetical protein
VEEHGPEHAEEMRRSTLQEAQEQLALLQQDLARMTARRDATNAQSIQGAASE